MSQAKLILRPPPHVDFIQGFPGIPASRSRSAASISGTVEVRLGSKGLKATWLRIELRKLEALPGGETFGELIGRGPIDVWSARTDELHKAEEERGWELLQTADFPFRIPIPEGLPPTARVDKACGINYELVTSLCVRSKKGLLRKETTSSIIQSTHSISIEKHELHSMWPLYHIPDEYESSHDDVKVKVFRDQTCFGPGDQISVRIVVLSNRVSPVKLKSVSVSLRETITFRGSAGKTKSKASQRSDSIAQKNKSVGKKIYKGDSQIYDLVISVPKTHQLMSIATAKHLDVSYILRVHVEVSGKPIIVDHMPVTITNFSRATSQTMVARIGFVPGLSSTEDDYSATRSLSDHNSAIHPPSLLRSQSYAGSSVAPATDPRDLRRQDSVISQGTQFSGPGMAGRGVPGQIFSWGAYGAAQAYDVQTAPRPAFAGPPSIFEGRELAPEENRALFHHSLRPQNAQMLGTDGGPLLASNTLNNPRNVNSIAEREEATSTGHGSPDAESLPRQRTVSSPAQPNGAGANLQHSMSVLSNDSAEAEKIRLYERARQQAERNQRRADEKRARTAAATAAGLSSDATSTILSSAPDSRASTPRIVPDGFGGFRARTPANNQRAVSVPLSSTAPERHSSIMAFNTAEEEKQRLYERARAEAEKYQSGYAQGASFPPPPDGGSNAAPESGTSSELGPPNADSFAEDRRRSSANYWIGAQGSSDAAGGISASQSDPTALASTAVGTSSRASVAYPTAEEEKRRLYEQAKAEADAYQRGEPSSSSSAAAGTRRQSMVAGYVSAEEEKRRLYEQAKAEADAYQRGEEPASRRPEYGHAAQPSFTSTQHATSSSPAQVPGAWAESSQNASASQLSTSSRPTPEDEKAQMRRFYEAQDAVLRSQGGGQSSTAGIAAGYHGGATREAYPSAPVPSYHQAVSSTASLPEMVAAAAVIPGGSPQSGEAHYLSASQAYNSVSTYTSPNMYRHSLGFNAHGPSLAESSGRNISSSHVPMESSIGADSGPRRAPSTSPSLLTNAEREKEQIRLYYAALDAQTEPNGGATGSGSGSGSGVSPRPPSASHARPASHFGFSSGPSVGSEPTHMRTSSAQACGGLPSSPARRTPSVIGGRPLPSTSHRFSSSPLPQPGPSAEQEKAQMAAYFAAKDAAEETARRRASVLPQYEASSSGHVDASSHPWSRPVSDWGRETTAAVYSSLVNNGTGETSGNANGSSGGLDGNKRFSARRSLDSVSTEDLPHHDPSISAGKQRAPLSPNGSIRPSTLSFSAGAGGLPFGLPGANTNTTAAAPAPAAQRVSPNGSTFSTSKVLAAPPKPIPAHDPSLWRPRYDWAERDMGLGEEEELASFEEHGPPAPKGSPPARPPKIPLA